MSEMLVVTSRVVRFRLAHSVTALARHYKVDPATVEQNLEEYAKRKTQEDIDAFLYPAVYYPGGIIRIDTITDVTEGESHV